MLAVCARTTTRLGAPRCHRGNVVSPSPPLCARARVRGALFGEQGAITSQPVHNQEQPLLPLAAGSSGTPLTTLCMTPPPLPRWRRGGISALLDVCDHSVVWCSTPPSPVQNRGAAVPKRVPRRHQRRVRSKIRQRHPLPVDAAGRPHRLPAGRRACQQFRYGTLMLSLSLSLARSLSHTHIHTYTLLPFHHLLVCTLPCTLVCPPRHFSSCSSSPSASISLDLPSARYIQAGRRSAAPQTPPWRALTCLDVSWRVNHAPCDAMRPPARAEG